MKTDEQSDARNTWYTLLDKLAHHSEKVCSMHGSNAPLEGFDMNAVKLACSRTNEIKALTPVEALPVIDDILIAIDPPTEIDEANHTLRSQLHDVWSARAILMKLKESAEPAKIAHGQQIIDREKNGAELDQILAEVIALRKELAQSGINEELVLDQNTKSEDWLQKKERLMRVAVEGANVTLAGPGASYPALSAMAELMAMHLQPMVDINLQLLTWYAQRLKNIVSSILRETASTIANTIKNAIQTVTKKALKLVEVIVHAVKTISESSTRDEDNSDEIQTPPSSIHNDAFPRDIERQETVCIDIGPDHAIISSIHHGFITEALLSAEADTATWMATQNERQHVSQKSPWQKATTKLIDDGKILRDKMTSQMFQNWKSNHLSDVENAAPLYFKCPSIINELERRKLRKSLAQALNRKTHHVDPMSAELVSSNKDIIQSNVLCLSIHERYIDFGYYEHGCRVSAVQKDIGLSQLDEGFSAYCLHELAKEPTEDISNAVRKHFVENTNGENAYIDDFPVDRAEQCIEPMEYFEACQETFIDWRKFLMANWTGTNMALNDGSYNAELVVIGNIPLRDEFLKMISFQTGPEPFNVPRNRIRIASGLHKIALDPSSYQNFIN